MNSVIGIKQDEGTYRQMRAQNPIKFAEYLCDLQKQGMSQAEIAELLGLNRQVVGRYKRIAMWDDDLKRYIEENRKCIKITTMLENSGKTTQEAFEIFKQLVAMKRGDTPPTPTKEEPKENTVEVKPLQVVPPLPSSEAEVEKTQEIALFCEKEVPECEVRKESPKQETEPSWMEVFSQIVTPSMFVLMVCTIGLSSYLVHQGVLFFQLHDNNATSVWSSAIVSEAIPILCAGCLALTRRFLHKLIASILLMGTIAGLGFFMHASISDSMQRQSGAFIRTESERKVQESSVKALVSSLNALPDTYVSKRQLLAEKITSEQKKLADLNHSLTKFEHEHSSVDRIALLYGVWLRIAAMLLNAFLVHLFFGRFKSHQGKLLNKAKTERIFFG